MAEHFFRTEETVVRFGYGTQIGPIIPCVMVPVARPMLSLWETQNYGWFWIFGSIAVPEKRDTFPGTLLYQVNLGVLYADVVQVAELPARGWR